MWVGFVCLLYWVVARWDIFTAPLADALFKTWLLGFLLVNTVQIAVRCRRTLTRGSIYCPACTRSVDSGS
jgi:hypothetical protein